MTKIIPIKSASEENNFIYLTFGIVLLLFVAALVEQFPDMPGKHFVQAFSVINILIGLFGFKTSASWIRTTPGFLLSILILASIGYLLEYLKLSYLHLILLLFFYIWAFVLACRLVFFTGSVDLNRIIGALCVYLLLGVIWALLYLFIAQAIPDAFTGLDQRPWYKNFSDIAYYSFATLTTLGYGDIAPVAPLARFLAYMEAILGVFYMAVLVASLVGIGINEAQQRKNS